MSARETVLGARNALLDGSGKLSYFERRGLSEEIVRGAWIGYSRGEFLYPCIGRAGALLAVHYKSEARNAKGKRGQRWGLYADDLPRKGHGKKPNDPAKIIPFGLETLEGLEPGFQVTLCCGEEDALSLRQAGFTALSQPGAGLLEPVYARELAGFEVVLVYDAGEEAEARKDALKLIEAGAQSVRIAEWPEDALHGADINGRLVEGPESFKRWAARMIQAARPVSLGGAQERANRVGRPDEYGGETRSEHSPNGSRPSEAPDGAELLEEVARFVQRFVVLTDAQAVMSALWVVHTHAFGAADTTPYLSITSAEKRSGKTRLLEVLAPLVANPWFTGRVSAAVLVRKTAAESPTLLLDESDAAFRGDKEYSEALRGILDSGFRRGGVTSLCIGQGASLSYHDFPVFGPKAIAGIGKLPDTVADRAIPIELRRRAPGEYVERFRFRKIEPEAVPLHHAAAAWAKAHLDALSWAEPELPEELDDRAQDIVEPLLAIADEVGGEWPERARDAAVALLTGEHREDSESLGVKLLRDIRSVFDKEGTDRLLTTDILTALNKRDDAPWGNLRGETLDARRLARLLKPYGVKPDQVWIDGANQKGYMRSWFADAWARYVPEDTDGDDDGPDDDGPTGSGKGDRWDRRDRAGENPHKQADSGLSDNLSDNSDLSGGIGEGIDENPHEQRTLSHLSHPSDNPGTGGEKSRQGEAIKSQREFCDLARSFFDLDEDEGAE